MLRNKFVLTALGLALLGTASVCGQAQQSKPKFNFVTGPGTARLSSVARIDLPAGYFFVDGNDYRAMLKAEGEPVSGREMGLLSSTNKHWSVIFKFDDIGYVKDDEKNSLDADKLLDSIRRGTAEANEQRAKAGRPVIQVVGWEFPPKYDEQTHNLEWAVRGTVEGHEILNYNTRLLGRKGVMEVVLVVRPEMFNDTLPDFRSLMAGYHFDTGQTYAEYRPGDKIAKYGLGALVLGGAAVGAAKLGLLTPVLLFLKKGWKLVVVAFAALASFVRKVFTGKTGKPAAG